MSVKKLVKYIYAISFLNGFIIWYAVDKLFYEQNGISLQQIVILGALAWVPQLLFEIPSSILADRWSRKYVLFLGQLGLLASTLIVGLGSSFVIFALGILVWAVAVSMMSGTYEAFIYDSLKEHNAENQYQKINGTRRSLFLFSMFFAGLCAMLISFVGDLTYTFYFSAPGILLSGYLILKLKEPPISRTSHQNLNWFEHTKDVAVVIRGKLLRWTIALIVFLVAFRSSMYEYYQVLGLEKGLSITTLALVFSLTVLGMSFASYIFGKISISKKLIAAVWLSFLMVTTLGLMFENKIFVVINLFLVFALMESIDLYLNLVAQNNIESSIRASVLSFASSLGQAVFLLYVVNIFFSVQYVGMTGALSLSAVPLLALSVVEIRRLRKRDLKTSLEPAV